MASKLDTRLWNLGFGAVIALSACKDPPQSPDDDGCADTLGGSCDYPPYDDYDYDDYDYDDDCGYECDYPDDDYDCDDYGDCDDYDECDYDPAACDIACYGDEDCEDGSACLQPGTETARCEPVVALEACPDRLNLAPVPVPPEEAVVSLTFADLDGAPGDELVIGRADRLEIFDGTSVVDTIPFEGAIAVAAGHFSGETGIDLAVAHENDVVVLAQAEDGTFSEAATVTVPTGNVVELLRIGYGDFDPPGLLARTDAFQVAVLLGEELSEAVVELPGVIASHVAVADFNGTPGDDIVVEDGGAVGIVVDTPANELEPLAVHDTPAVHIAAGSAMLVRTFEREGQTILEPNTLGEAFPLQALSIAPGRITLGDLDGDANADVVMTDSDRASIAFGAPPGAAVRFECQATHYLGVARTVIATGDLDGDGRTEVAWGGANGLVVFSPQ